LHVKKHVSVTTQTTRLQLYPMKQCDCNCSEGRFLWT